MFPARFKGRLKAWLQAEHSERFKQVPVKAWWLKWVADVQPVGAGDAALKYLAAYLCRPPLHESQIETWDAQTVTFRYRENGGAQNYGTVNGQEFVRRVLQHVLLDWRVPALVPPTPVPPPQCPGCGLVMVLIARVARKPP